jgi:PAS domain S-box-containing protein
MLVREAPIGVAFLSTDLRYVLVNERLAQINGIALDEHLGRTVQEMLGDLAAVIEPRLRTAITSGRRLDSVEISGHLAGDPEEHTWEQSVFPVIAADGEILGAGVVVEDVTDRRRSRNELQRMYVREREIANRFQAGLRPGQLQAPDGYELVTRYVAGSAPLQVGGDWFDTIAIDENRFVVAIGDVVGHGIDAALTMARVRFGLSGLAHATDDPGRLIDRLDEFVTPDGPRFVATAFLGILAPSTGTIRFGSAGHPPPLIVRARGSVEPIQAARSTPLGIFGEPQPTASAVLEAGDSLLLYTDGLIERRGETIDEGIRRLMGLAGEPFTDLEQLLRRLLESSPDPEHPDDIAIMILRRRDV